MAGLKNLINKKYSALKKSITMLDIKIIFLLYIFFSQYFKLSSSKVTSFLIRCYCSLVSVLVIYLSVNYLAHLIQNDIKGVAVNSIVLIEYIVVCFVSQITGHAYLSAYTNVIISSDSLLNHPKAIFGIKSMFQFILFCFCLGAFSLCIDMFKSKFWAEMFSLNRYNVLLLLSSQYLMMSIDMTSFKILLAVGFLQNRLMLMRKTLEDTVPVCDEERNVERLRVIRKCLRSYQMLFDAFGKVYGHLQWAMFMLIIFDVPRLIMFGYTLLKQIIYHKYTARIIIVDAVRYLTRIVAPCIICELCYNEVDRLKMLLTQLMIQSSDSVLRAELQRALDYVRRRPFSFTLLRMRVDIKLPVTICALAFTYIIILIEFTHFVL